MELSPTQTTTRHLAHVRVRLFEPGDPVTGRDIGEEPGDLALAHVWACQGAVSGRPEDAGWLGVRQLGPGGAALLYTAALPLVSAEILPLFCGASAVDPAPHDHLHYALHFEGWPDVLVDADSLGLLQETAEGIANALGEASYQGVFFVGAFDVSAESGRYVSVRFAGNAAPAPSGSSL